MRAWKIAGGLCGGATFEGVEPPTPSPGFFQDFETNSNGFVPTPGASFTWARTQTWTDDGTWSFGSTNQGVDSVTCGTDLSLVLAVDSILTFDFRVSSETSYDGLAVVVDTLVDGTVTASEQWSASRVTLVGSPGQAVWASGAGYVILTGQNPTGSARMPIAAGNIRIRFVYVKDSSSAGGADTAWIDNVRVAPSS